MVTIMTTMIMLVLLLTDRLMLYIIYSTISTSYADEIDHDDMRMLTEAMPRLGGLRILRLSRKRRTLPYHMYFVTLCYARVRH